MPSPLHHRFSTSGIVLLYAGFASLWIIASDGLLSLSIDDPVLLSKLGIIKGIAFVGVTASLLYLLLRGWVESRTIDREGLAATSKPRQHSLALVFIGLALLPALLGVGIVYLHGPQLEREAYANLHAVADLKAEQIARWLAERRSDGEVLAADLGFARQVEQLLDQNDDLAGENILSRLEGLRAIYGYTGALLLDAQGQTRLYRGHHAAAPAHLQPLLAQALNSGQTQRSDLYRDETGRIHLDWVAPITLNGPEGQRRIAAVVLHADPQAFLFPFIQRWPTLSHSAETLVVRREGESVLFLNELRHRPDPALTLRQPLDSAELPAAIAVRSDQASTTPGIDYRGIAVLAAFRPIAETDWRLVAKIDRAEVLAPLHYLVFWVSVVALFTIAVVAMAFLLLWRQQQRTHRFELLAQAAEQDRLLRKFYDLPFIGMALTSPETKRWLQCNGQLCEILGYSREALVNMTWAEITHPDDLAADVAEFERVMRGESEGYTLDKRFIRSDSAVVFTTMDVKCLRCADGTVELFIATINDITERQHAAEQIRRLNQLYRVLSNINQIIVRRKEPAWILREACQIAVRDGGLRVAWVGMIHPDTGQVRPIAHAGPIGDYLEKISITLVGPYSEGPTGTALRTGQVVVCNDIAHDPRMALWREPALALGCHASIALPLVVRGAVRGALSLYASTVDFFDAQEIALLEELSSDIAYALEVAEADQERLQIEQALRESRERFRRAVDEAPFPIMLHAEDGEVLALSRAWTEITGYTRADIPTIADWTRSAYGERQQAVRAVIDQLYDLQQRKTQGEYQITCKDGSLAARLGVQFSGTGLPGGWPAHRHQHGRRCHRAQLGDDRAAPARAAIPPIVRGQSSSHVGLCFGNPALPRGE